MVFKILPFFIVWTFLHILLWAFAPHPRLRYAPEYFFPFGGSLRHYDITEFLIYVGTPFVIYLVYRCYKPSENHP